MSGKTAVEAFVPKENPYVPINTGVVPPHLLPPPAPIPFEPRPKDGTYYESTTIDVQPVAVNGQPVATFKASPETVTLTLPRWALPVGALILLYLLSNKRG
jgi:hypothetical protein